MTTTHKQNISQLLQNYISDHQITQTVVSDRTGVRKEYINTILKGVFTYNAGGDKTGDIPDRHFFRIADLIDYTIEKRYWASQPTSQFTQMIAILDEARKHAYTRLIIGATGSGKSHAIELYVKQHPQDVFCVKVGREDTLKVLLRKVAAELRIPASTQKSEIISDITGVLRMYHDKGRKPQLIFDESEYMRAPALCSIKEFYDYLDKYCSIVLVGTDQLTNQINKLRLRNTQGIPQLYRRIKFGIRNLPTIDRSFKLFLKEIEDKEVAKFLKRECDNYGELHDVLVPCLREADRLEVPLTIGLMKQVLNIQTVAFV